MKKDDFQNRLENLSIDAVPPPETKQLKLAIINAKQSVRVSLWLLMVPFLLLFSAMFETIFHISIPPWSILKTYGHLWPQWVRVGVFTCIVIVIPLTAVILNLLAIIWFRYDRALKVLNIAIRFKKTNVIILLIAGIIAILFIGHTIADCITGR